ncbi:MAG: GntR family transcriptional regulator [Dongiaceae bacterium]
MPLKATPPNRLQPRPAPSKNAADRTLATRTYGQLKDMILAGRLRPGEKLAERDLGATLKVSRTPIREALGRLVQDGLVEYRPQRGHFVRAIDMRSVEDLYSLREMLEVYAIRLAMSRMQRTDFAEFDRLSQSLERYATDPVQSEPELREGQRVHEIIARAARDELLYEMLMRLYDRLQLFIWIDALYADEARLTRAEHAEIIAAIKAEDVERVVHLATQHLRRSRANVLRVLQARPSLTG